MPDDHEAALAAHWKDEYLTARSSLMALEAEMDALKATHERAMVRSRGMVEERYEADMLLKECASFLTQARVGHAQDVTRRDLIVRIRRATS